MGSIGLAVISVSRWQDVAGELEAKFPSDETTVWDRAIPVTSSVSDRILDIMAAKLGVSLAGTIVNDSQTLTSSSTRESGSKTDEAGTVTETSSETEKDASDESRGRTRQTPGEVTDPALRDGGADKVGTPPTSRATGISAFTRYTAANALKQEIVVLNRYVRDAVQRTGYEPFLVRMQFGVQPRQRQQPFDTIMRVSFLPSPVAPPETTKAATASLRAEPGAGSTFAALFGMRDPEEKGWPGQATNSIPANDSAAFADLFNSLSGGGSTLTSLNEDASTYRLSVRAGGEDRTYTILKPCFFRHLAGYLASPGIGIAPARSYRDLAGSARFAPVFFEQLNGGATALTGICPGAEASATAFDHWTKLHAQQREALPVVVPLVVTDSLEGTQEYQAVQNLRQAALALSAVGGPARGTASFNRTVDRLQEYEATRLNSVYSIGRLSENTIQVRMGATRYGNKFEMVPRSVQSTLLLLVPREQAGQIVELVARPSFNNANTGAILRLSSEEALREPSLFGQRLIDRDKARAMCGLRRNAAETAVESCRKFLTQVSRYAAAPDGWTAFRDKLKTSDNSLSLCLDGKDVDLVCANDLYAELLREQQRVGAMSRARVEIPALRQRDLPPQQTASARTADKDDKITVVGIDPWLKPSIRARAGADCRARNGDGYEGVMATRLDVVDDVGTFTVPRPAKADGSEGEPPATLCLWLDNSAYAPLTLGLVDGFSAGSPRRYPVRFGKKDDKAAEKPAKAAFDIAISGQTVVTQRNRGTVRLVIRNFDKAQIDRIVFTAEDGVIVGASGNATFEGKTYTAVIAADGAVELPVESIDTQDRKVRIRADGMKGDKVVKTSHADVQLREGSDG
jgi:hypothetical protein